MILDSCFAASAGERLARYSLRSGSETNESSTSSEGDRIFGCHLQGQRDIGTERRTSYDEGQNAEVLETAESYERAEAEPREGAEVEGRERAEAEARERAIRRM